MKFDEQDPYIDKLEQELREARAEIARLKAQDPTHQAQGYCAPCDGTCLVHSEAARKPKASVSSDTYSDCPLCEVGACPKHASDEAFAKATVLKDDDCYYWTPEAWATFQRYRQALEKLTLGWLYWPSKNQPDPRVTKYDSRTLDEIEAMAKAALSSKSNGANDGKA